MSDQNSPLRPTPPRPATAAGEGYRSDVRIDTTAPPRSGGGFTTGVLVAIVVAVIAIMAAVLLGNGDRFGLGSGGTSDGLTIENNVANPPADAPATVAPVAPATPDVPDTSVPLGAPDIPAAPVPAPDPVPPAPAPAPAPTANP